MNDDTLIVERLDGGIARLTLNRPEKRNAIDPALRESLRTTFLGLAADAELRAVIVAGAGGHFSAGGDVASLGAMRPGDGAARMAHARDTVLAIAACPAPVVACVEGHAAGAGVGLALLCDEVIADPGAKFTLAFGRIGLAVDWGLSATLPDRIGRAAARRLAWDANTVDAESARAMGLIDRVAAGGAAMDETLARAVDLASRARAALRGVKKQMRIPLDTLRAALDLEAGVQIGCFHSEDFREGTTAFVEKRAARFGPS